MTRDGEINHVKSEGMGKKKKLRKMQIFLYIVFLTTCLLCILSLFSEIMYDSAVNLILSLRMWMIMVVIRPPYLNSASFYPVVS